MYTESDIWNILHDGQILKIEYISEGNIKFVVSIEYLRRILVNHGDEIDITLIDCPGIEYYIWDLSKTSSDIKEIEKIKPIILSTDSKVMPLKIVTTHGDLSLNYKSFIIHIDGEIIPYEKLLSACKQYWDNFGK